MGGGGSQSTGESWSRTTPGFMDELSTMLHRTMSGSTGFSTTDALNDVQGVIQQNAINSMQEALPKIAGSERTAGAYGSTTRSLMNNDLQARIAGQMAATQLQAVQDYAGIESDRIRAFASATQAGTSTASEHFENSRSRNASPWGNFFGGILRPVVGGAIDAVAGEEKGGTKVGDGALAGFANGGIVPARKSQTQEDKFLETQGLEAVANSYLVDRSREQKLQQQQQAAIASSTSTKKTESGDDDELFRLIGII